MRLSHRPLGVVGLVAVAVVALGLLQGRLTVEQAGKRGLVVLVVLVVVDRFLVPLAQALVGPRAEPEPEVPAEQSALPPGTTSSGE